MSKNDVITSSNTKGHLLDEAARLMTICNACRYCEGHCAVFPAMERRLNFGKDSIDFLANLCHQCGACYHHCQYAAPHEFDVHVPKVFAEVRQQSYADYAWPSFMGRAFSQGFVFSLGCLVLFVGLLTGFTIMTSGGAFFEVSQGGFYGLISHNLMVAIFAPVFLFSVLSISISLCRYWRAIGLPGLSKVPISVLRIALSDALKLKNLGGGHGKGCYVPTEAPSNVRRWCHHLMMYGFLLCFLATSIATLYHYAFGWPAPYGWTSLPKISGTLGGIGIVIGGIGLIFVRLKTDQAMRLKDDGLSLGFTFLLIFTALSGLLLPLLGKTMYLGLLLTTHLGAVMALFLVFAYGKFVHGLYRLVALIADANEQYQVRTLQL